MMTTLTSGFALGLIAALVAASPLPSAGALDGPYSNTKASACISLMPQIMGLDNGPTLTVWTATMTTTNLIDCVACSDALLSQVPLGVPPVVIFSATTTAPGTLVTTVVDCSRPTILARME